MNTSCRIVDARVFCARIHVVTSVDVVLANVVGVARLLVAERFDAHVVAISTVRLGAQIFTHSAGATLVYRAC